MYPLEQVEFEQRHRAILSADLVGYTRLMESAEMESHRRFRSLRTTVLDPLIIDFRGELIKNTGDGFICVFEEPVDALTCAVEMQAKIAAFNTTALHADPLNFRMGVHWGQVILDMDDVYGNDVNIAVRLQEAAIAGKIIVSDEIVTAAQGGAKLSTRNLGELPLKGLSYNVPAHELGVPEARNLPAPGVQTSKANPPSLAVLPLEDDGLASDLKHVGTGFVDDVVVSLANLNDIFTISRGSAAALQAQGLSTDEIAQRLGVRYVLSGRIRNTSGKWRVNTELMDTSDGTIMSADRHEFDPQETFDLQDEITGQVARKISSVIHDSQLKTALRKQPHSLSAYENYLRGIELLHRLNPTEFSAAKTFLTKALEIDPEYAAATAHLALWTTFNVAEGWSTDRKSDIDSVARLAAEAMGQDPKNVLSHAVFGHVNALFEHDPSAAILHLDEARRTAPSSSWAWVFSSAAYGFIGESDAAIDQSKRALRLSPFDRYTFFSECLLAQNHYLAGDYQKAAIWARKAVFKNPRFGNATRILIASNVALDQMGDAQRFVIHHKEYDSGFSLEDYRLRCPFDEADAAVYVDRLAAAGLK